MKFDTQIKRMIKVEQSSVIGTCSHLTFVSDYEKSIIALTGGELRNPVHSIKQLHKSIKCTTCNKMWCCDECAIEDDAIPGFLTQWRKFRRRISKENKNMRLVTCLKCQGLTLSEWYENNE